MENEKRLFSADDFKKLFYVDDDCDEIRLGVDGKVFVDFKAVQRAIDEAPTVDAVEVVRCKDCKACEMCYPEKHLDREATQAWLCKRYKRHVKPDDFCSYGERREGE